MKAVNLAGRKFKYLIAISPCSERRITSGGNLKIVWNCECKCGKSVKVPAGNLTSGNTKSCGCLQTEASIQSCLNRAKHNLKNHYIYSLWAGMKSRCYRKTDPAYARYGGRGIDLCEALKASAVVLYEVLGERPEGRYESGRPKWSIDRIDNEGGYWCGRCHDCIKNKRPQNIRWATCLEQNQNARQVNNIFYHGEKMCVSQACRVTGINRRKITNLAKLGKAGFSL